MAAVRGRGPYTQPRPVRADATPADAHSRRPAMGSLSPMQLGAHLPLIDFDGRGWPAGRVATYARAARDLGYDFVCANDHLAFEKPWLDGIVALASVADQTGEM